VQKKFIAVPSTTVARRKIYRYHLVTEQLSLLVYSAKGTFAITYNSGVQEAIVGVQKVIAK